MISFLIQSSNFCIYFFHFGVFFDYYELASWKGESCLTRWKIDVLENREFTDLIGIFDVHWCSRKFIEGLFIWKWNFNRATSLLATNNPKFQFLSEHYRLYEISVDRCGSTSLISLNNNNFIKMKEMPTKFYNAF